MLEINQKIDSVIEKNLHRVIDEVARLLSLPKNIKVNLNFVDEKTIQELNKSTRAIDKVTDVLTYPYVELKPNEKLDVSKYSFDLDPTDGTLTIGDIYICVPRAREQADAFNHSLNREICFLFCHGLLHICGYDHINEKDSETMEALQEKILDSLKITREIAFRSGFVTVIGKTNAGKSTLINNLVGEHVSIVSPKSQTTRENIKGIYNDCESQIVFVDTPGYHKRATLVDEEMDKQIADAMLDTEIVLMLIDAKKPIVKEYNELIKKVSPNAKKILLINKIDEKTYESLYPQLAELNSVARVDEILPVSALKGKNLDVLIAMIKKYLPVYDHEMRYYPLDEYTDKNLRHMVSEIVREKALLFLDDEIPHGIQVVTTSFEEAKEPIEIHAEIYCEKENHKAIILGKNGDMIKKISTSSRLAIEKLLNAHINLQLYVKVKPNWRNDARAINEFGLSISE